MKIGNAKLKVYVKVVKEDIRCICLRSHKNCDRICEKGEVTYNQYLGIDECIKNKGNKNYRNG